MGQNPLDQRISLEIRQWPLEEALYALIEAGAPLSFSNSIIPQEYKVSLSANEMRLEDVLQYLLAGTDLIFEEQGSIVVIRQRERIPEFVVHGYVRDKETGEPLVGAVVYDSILQRGGQTNAYGFYSLRLPKGKRYLKASYLGYGSFSSVLDLKGDRALDVYLESSLLLMPVVILDTSSSDLLLQEVWHENLYRPDLKALPALGGERDLFRLVYLQAGVQTGADGFGGMSVHGGGVDQNLVLLDGVPVYNPSHMVGLFSIFDDRVVHSARFWSKVFPARYGDRASSVLDVRTREGNINKARLNAYLALTSAGLMAEGPLKKEKSSFFLSFRRSLLDVYQAFYHPSDKGISPSRSRYYFYDFTAKVNTRLGARNRLFLSYYRGLDYFRNESSLSEESADTLSSQYLRDLVTWGNNIAVLRLNREISDRLFLNLTGTFSRFFFEAKNQFSFEQYVGGGLQQSLAFFGGYSSNNRDWALKLHVDFALNPRHYVRYGGSVTWHRFQPAAIFFDQKLQIDTLDFILKDLQSQVPQQTREVALYIEDEFEWGEHWKGNLGLRHNILLLDNYTTFALQPRFFLSYHFTPAHLRHTFYLGGGRFFQPVHLLSSSGIGLPRDLWVSATRRVPPIESWAFHAGWRALWQGQLQWDVSGYYKFMKHVLAFNQGASTTINAQNWQNHVLQGVGWSYGTDFSLRWKQPSWILSLTYTWSKTMRRFADINRGEAYPYRYDRRHNFNMHFIYKPNCDWMWSVQWIWQSGMAITLPRKLYQYNQLNLLYSNFPPQFPFIVEVPFSEKQNDFRMPPYHRLDVSGSWSAEKGGKWPRIAFGVYNVYVQKNPLYYFIQRRPDENGNLKSAYYRFVLLPVLPYLRISWTL